MPEFLNIGRNFRRRLRTLDGTLFYGALSEFTETGGRGSQFFNPRRVLDVSANCQIRAGQLMVDEAGTVSLIAWNGPQESRQGIYAQTFRLYDMDRQAVWFRTATTVDPVTKQPRSSAPVNLGSVWIAKELLTVQDEFGKVVDSEYRILCNADLQVGDRLDTMVVKRVENVLGVTLAQAQ